MHADGGTDTVKTPEDPLQLIQEELASCRPVKLPGMPPFMGGAVGFVGYEYVQRIETTIPPAGEDSLGMPLLYFMLTDNFVILTEPVRPFASVLTYILERILLVPTKLHSRP